ncbi:MAG: cellulose biosynthesis cyclic di-GMP-binding regulatory protein BcsB [Chloroflexota bacterium]
MIITEEIKRIVQVGLSVCIALTLVMGLFFLPSFSVFAQEPEPVATEAVPIAAEEEENEYRFSVLGYEEQTLHGPYDSISIVFGIPGDWELIEGTEVRLDLSVFFTAADGTTGPANEVTAFGGMLDVVFNDITLTTVLLNQSGEIAVNVPVPADAFIPAYSQGRHELRLVLNAEEDCLYDWWTTVVVRSTSRFILPHRFLVPTTDLTQLPKPIHQEDSVAPDLVTIVIPDEPNGVDLQAVLAVAAGFGRMTAGGMVYTFVPASQLTEELRANSHLIFVGKPVAFSILVGVGFPVPIVGNQFDVSAAQPDDGIVQMAHSPWNQSKVILLVSGTSDVGITKAGQAISSGLILSGEPSDLALVAEVRPGELATYVPTDRTFADLGYASEQINRVGIVNRDYIFYVPPGQVAEEGAYLELRYTHSTLLDYNRSGLVISLNDELIGSERFSDATSQQAVLRVTIPPRLLRVGNNRISIRADLFPLDTCSSLLLYNKWLSLSSDSLLHISFLPVLADTTTRVLDLAYYPDLFALSPGEGGVVFILPLDDVNAWKVAAQIAFDLGAYTEWTLAEHLVYLGSEAPESVLQTRDLVVVGRASTLPIIATLGDALPAPFEAGSDVVTSTHLQIEYRLPTGASIGYLELLTSPWNTDGAILAVLGNSDLGIQWAGNALTVPELQGKLAGNFALVNDDQIATTDTRIKTGVAAVVATPAPGGVTRPTTAGEVTVSGKPNWVIPVLGGVLVLIVLVILIAISSSIRRLGRQS